ncbi:M48 family metallopeptidase [Cytophagaceae bacterium AH-315-L13]|nr:M48 family metallopeptidase [Cytophagaceae bacterium AH-315-L13]
MMVQTLFYIIIGILILEYLLDRFLDYKNQLHWSTELPEELKGIYDEESYKKSQKYDKVNYRFGLWSSGFSLVVILIMIVGGGFALVDDYARSFSENLMVISLAFFGVLFFFNDIISIPFSIYHTFVIEKKFGFNKTTVKTFCVDKLKGYLLTIIIGGGLLSLFVLFYQWAGSNFWIYFWIVITAFLLFMFMFYTSLILPLFNKLTPLEDGELRKAIEEYTNKVDFPLTNIMVIDGSKRSTKANAFFSGIGSRKKIVLYDTLIKDHTSDELVAVLAHEVGHYKKKHTSQGIIMSILQTGLMLFLLSWFIDVEALSQAMGAKEGSFYMGLLAFGILYSPISTIMELFMNLISRKNEFEADEFAAKTFSGEYLVTALKKLSVNNLSNLNPHPLYVFFNYSHPPLLERLRAIKKYSS